MARLYLLFFVAQVALAVSALISCLSAEEDDINAVPRMFWILIILFAPLIGSIAWFIAGRTSTRQRGAWWTGGGSTEPRQQRPLAPDDDPEFLRSLNIQPKQRDDDQPQE